MKHYELDETIAALRRLLASGDEAIVTDPRLRTALRKFEEAKEGGRLDRRRIEQASKLVILALAGHLVRDDLNARKKTTGR
jgi:hypothetical protein